MLSDKLKIVLECIIEGEDPSGERYQRGMKQWIMQKREPVPEKGRRGDVYATRQMHRVQHMKRAVKSEVRPDERAMLYRKTRPALVKKVA